MKDVFAYVSRPYFSKPREKLSRKTFSILGNLLWVKFALTFLAYFLIQFLFTATQIESPERTARKLVDSDLQKLIRIIVILPIFEELIFRSWLNVRWGIKYIFPWVTAFFIWSLSKFLGIEISSTVVWICVFILIAYMAWASTALSEERSIRFVDKIFPFAFWISALTFALMHLTNYKAEQLGFLAVLMVLPQFIGGAFYGYVTKYFGFWASVGCHVVWNGSLTLLAFSLT